MCQIHFGCFLFVIISIWIVFVVNGNSQFETWCFLFGWFDALLLMYQRFGVVMRYRALFMALEKRSTAYFWNEPKSASANTLPSLRLLWCTQCKCKMCKVDLKPLIFGNICLKFDSQDQCVECCILFAINWYPILLSFCYKFVTNVCGSVVIIIVSWFSFILCLIFLASDFLI